MPRHAKRRGGGPTLPPVPLQAESGQRRPSIELPADFKLVPATHARAKPTPTGEPAQPHRGADEQVIDLVVHENLVGVVQRLTDALALVEARAADVETRLAHAELTVAVLRQQLTDAGLTPEVVGADVE